MPGPSAYDFNFVLHDTGGHNVSFEAANQDLTDATYQYFGFVSSFGSWLVMRFHIIGSTIIYEYFAGKTRTTYDALWNGTTGRYIGTLTFTTFDQITVL
jgi:hypothetical protein